MLLMASSMALAATIDCLEGISCLGTKEDDTMTGTATEDWMSGGAGGDLMYGLGSTDFLFGQNGGDTLVGDSSCPGLLGGARPRIGEVTVATKPTASGVLVALVLAAGAGSPVVEAPEGRKT